MYLTQLLPLILTSPFTDKKIFLEQQDCHKKFVTLCYRAWQLKNDKHFEAKTQIW